MLDPDACKLCGRASLQLEPPVLYCSGMSCGMSRIKRNAVYYADAKDQNFWCRVCYSDLKPNELIMLDDGSEINKSRLISAKHDSLPEEAFVHCNDCHARVHHICALFNSRKATSKDQFHCPKCVLVHRTVEPTQVVETAKDLPSCKMSDFMETGLSNALSKAYEERALKLGIDVAAVEKVKGLSVRVVSHVKKKHAVRDEVRMRLRRWSLCLLNCSVEADLTVAFHAWFPPKRCTRSIQPKGARLTSQFTPSA